MRHLDCRDQGHGARDRLGRLDLPLEYRHVRHQRNRARRAGVLDSLLELYASWGVDFLKVDDMLLPYAEAEIELLRMARDRSTATSCSAFRPARWLSRRRHICVATRRCGG